MSTKTNDPNLTEFAVRVYFLLDRLPFRAHETYLPGFEIKVFLLLGEVPTEVAGLHRPDQLTLGGDCVDDGHSIYLMPEGSAHAS